MTQLLRCHRCSETKPAEDFYLSAKYEKKSDRYRYRPAPRSYRNVWCKTCKSAYDRKRRQDNPELFAAQRLAKYLRELPEGKNAYRSAVARAKSKGALITLTLEEWQEICASEACHWCSATLHRSFRHIDHIVPLAKGGEHTKSNLVASCANCNQRRRWEQITKFIKNRL